MITVFVGTYNRVETLERTIRSYEGLETPHEVVIVDNGTDHPRCLEMLAQLEKQVKKIYSFPGISSMEEATDHFNAAIRDQFKSGGGDWFAVSEADVCFEGTDPRALDAYVRVATATGRAAGAHLRVDEGIPITYPLRSRVLACESRVLYRRDMEWIDDIPYSPWQIDTTFHLFPRTDFFDRLNLNPLRVGPPFDAMHLDWYLDINRPNEENKIYITNRDGVGSWGRQWLSDFWHMFQENKESAFEFLSNQKRIRDDLCVNSFMLSWCYQVGAGVERDLVRSRELLLDAIPYPHPYYWQHERDWMAMIYQNDFTSLGWQ